MRLQPPPDRILAALAWMVLLLCLAGAAPAWAVPSPEPAPPAVTAGIPPVGYLAQRVAGGLVRVEVLAGQGQSPHTFEPTPRQVAALASSRAYLSAGLPFEERLLKKAMSANPGLNHINTIEGLDLRRMEEAESGHQEEADHGHEAGELDVHVWLSPRLAQRMAQNIAAGLSRVYPQQAAQFQKNLAVLVQDLGELDLRLGEALALMRGRAFLVYHPAFGYLGREYGLRQIAVETGGKEPGPRYLANLMETAKREGVKVIFVQPQFPSKSAQQVARAIGGVVVSLDPLASDYLANLELIARQLSAHLQAEGRQ